MVTFKRKKIYLLADTETAGLDPTNYSLLTAGFIAVDEKKKELGRLLIEFKRERYAVNPTSLQINKLDLSRLYSEGKTSEDATAALKSFLSPWTNKAKYEIILVCHNVMFDSGFLSREFPWLKEVLSYRSVCTIGVALTCVDAGLIDLEQVKLEKLTAYFNIPHDAHSAMGDCEALLAVWSRMIALMSGAEVREKCPAT